MDVNMSGGYMLYPVLWVVTNELSAITVSQGYSRNKPDITVQPRSTVTSTKYM